MLDDSPKDSQETEWFITVRGYRLNSAKGKGAWDEIQEKPGASFQVFSPSGTAWMCLIFPAMCKVLPARGTHLSLGVQSFYWGSVM